MRPTPDQLLASLRVSLNDTVLPQVDDRWARYVGTAMDLVLQHLQLRFAGELDALGVDNLDMSHTLTELAARAVQLGSQAGAGTERWERLLAALADHPEPTSQPLLAPATSLNESLRQRVVDVLRWLDDVDPSDEDADVAAMRADLHRLIRRQVDRVNTFVEPLYMSFGPAVAP